MAYISEEISKRIDEGFLARQKLDELEDIIYDLCDLDYQKGEMKLREGVTIEDFISGVSMALCGYASKWESCRRLKKQEEEA